MNLAKTQFRPTKAIKTVVVLVLNLVLVTVVVLSGSALHPDAVASPIPTQGSYSRTDFDNSLESQGTTNDSENLLDDVRATLQDTAENVREKLNLDEPISPSTKEFIHDVQEKISHPLSAEKNSLDRGYDSN